jgi:hypothetical protein
MRSKTIRKLHPDLKDLARLANDLSSVDRRLKNLIKRLHDKKVFEKLGINYTTEYTT